MKTVKELYQEDLFGPGGYVGSYSAFPAPAGYGQKRAIEDSKKIEAEGRILRGFAAKFNQWSRPNSIRKGFFEMLKPGVFGHSLWSAKHLSRDITCLLDHDDDLLLGSLAQGNLKLYENDRGLRFELELPNTKLGNDVLLRSVNSLVEMSIQFGAIDDDLFRKWGHFIRVIGDADLSHVSLVPRGAYATFALPSNEAAAKREIQRIAKIQNARRRRQLELLRMRV